MISLSLFPHHYQWSPSIHGRPGIWMLLTITQPFGLRHPTVHCLLVSSRVSVFVAKKHSRGILRKMLLECFFATKTLMREAQAPALRDEVKAGPG